MKKLGREITICPKCGATCLVGHDDDRMVFCAVCSHSFRADSTTATTDDEFKRLHETYNRYEKGGWVAFKPKN